MGFLLRANSTEKLGVKILVRAKLLLRHSKIQRLKQEKFVFHMTAQMSERD